MARAIPLAILLLTAARGGAGATPSVGAGLTPVFVIDKSTNRNQVVYALALDRTCAFRTDAPVEVFWRMRERGEQETEGLLDWEKPIVGLGAQQITERRPDGGTVVVAIRALPKKPLTFFSRRAGDRCEVAAATFIDGREAAIQRIFAKLWLFGVEYVALEGLADGGPVAEILR
jgi:hypothetical protein